MKVASPPALRMRAMVSFKVPGRLLSPASAESPPPEHHEVSKFAMAKHLAILAGIALALLAAASLARADDAVPRLALVIGNGSYPDAEAPLKEAASDARAIADELKRDGFAI